MKFELHATERCIDMNHNRRTRTVKGFTLIELIIVIAIIGILVGILMPSMMNYYRRSRIQAANADAKMVYNAAQTAVQRYISIDRTAADASGFNGTVDIQSIDGVATCAIGMNDFESVTTGTNVAQATRDACGNVVTSVNRTVSDGNEICWAVRVDNYIVKAAVSAPTAGTTNVGWYSANRQFATMDNRATTAYFDASTTDAALHTFLGSLTSGYNNTPVTPTP